LRNFVSRVDALLRLDECEQLIVDLVFKRRAHPILEIIRASANGLATRPSQLSFKKRAELCGPSTLEVAVLLETAF